ncbi:MAG: hypothetical protein JSS16_05445 [Proteobacteria bacterium]|nr:hypothetical protein [Pseudomonadota bacterium]
MKNQWNMSMRHSLVGLLGLVLGLAQFTFDARAASLSDTQRATSLSASGLGISELLAQAGKAIAEGRLVGPGNESAIDYYAAVLDRDPHNPIAEEGMRELLPMAAGAIERMIGSGYAERGLHIVDMFARVEPNNHTLAVLRQFAVYRLRYWGR